MAVPAVLRSLQVRVLTENWQPVIAGIAVMVLIGFLSVFTGNPEGLVVTAAIGGLVAGFLFGKHTKCTTGIGFRVGFIGGILALCVGFLLMGGGFWTVEYGPVNDIVGEGDLIESGPEAYDAGESSVKEPGVGDSGMEASGAEAAGEGESGKKLSTKTSIVYLLIFGLIFIPASVLFAMIGTAIGTNIRRAVVPDAYNPPLL